MKTPLQKLWKYAGFSGRCPQPKPHSVLCRVNAALDGKPHSHCHLWSMRSAAILTAAVLLLTGIASASSQAILPAQNVLNTFFPWDSHDEYATTLVNAENYSISDDHFTLSVTSSIATERKVYFTLDVEGKTEEAREFLQSEAFRSDTFISPLSPFSPEKDSAALIYKVSWLAGASGGRAFHYNRETGTASVDVTLEMGIGLDRHVSVRLNQMEEGLWLDFPVKTVHDVKLDIHAEGQGRGTFSHAAGGPVKLETLQISPLDVTMKYSTPCDNEGAPVLFFLWKDGTRNTWGQLHIGDHHSGHGTAKEDWWHHTNSWQFGGVQDISQMEAVIFEGMAYPLDGEAPYEIDVSDLPKPFTLPQGEMLPGCQYKSVPLFALCDTLNIPYTWDENNPTAVMTYRDVTMTFSLDSCLVKLEGASTETAEMAALPVYQNGELWADAHAILPTYWSVGMQDAFENTWADSQDPNYQESMETSTWLVLP